jgi:hypothetical protein
MNNLGRIVAIAAIAFALPVHAQDRAPQDAGATPPAAVGGPLALTYVISGVRDDGGAENVGSATTFHCTNTSPVAEQIQFVLRNFNGIIAANITVTVGSANTHTKSTHGTAITEDLPHLSPGVAINQGMMFIFATSQFVFCTAVTVDAANPNVGFALHMVRFQPLSGTQE